MSKLDEIFSKNTIAATSEPVGLKDGMIKMISFNKVIIDINKTKQDIKDLMLELIGSTDTTFASAREYADTLSKKVGEL